ncbi:hypothetical protein T4C_8037 [Trichinella pseudospiralis]|uniref:Uncharacterized protein n=1 Tax=Trichinella pseudospiralis TaxID=6337 RepID=A0A0V1JTY5_TRIPS|nr:hypothetical protein T4C_8037 [Trichinella pseudospiralis]
MQVQKYFHSEILSPERVVYLYLPQNLFTVKWFRKNKRSDCNFAAGEIPNLTELAGLIPIGDG